MAVIEKVSLPCCSLSVTSVRPVHLYPTNATLFSLHPSILLSKHSLFPVNSTASLVASYLTRPLFFLSKPASTVVTRSRCLPLSGTRPLGRCNLPLAVRRLSPSHLNPLTTPTTVFDRFDIASPRRRLLTHTTGQPLFLALVTTACNVAMSSTYAVGTMLQSPGSPPGMTTSKSSKSSSFHSLNSDDSSVLADIGHFEEIGLDDDHGVTPKASAQILTRRITSPSSNTSPVVQSNGRTLAAGANRRGPAPRRSFPNLRNNLYAANPRSTSTAALTDPRTITLKKGHSTTSLPQVHRQRSISPALSNQSQDSAYFGRPRRGSWQANRDRKSISDLERECDEDEGDDIPDGLVLDNVPISPRPQYERPPSRAPSAGTSPERTTKERVRSVGNGTPAVAQAQGSLRSPTWNSRSYGEARGAC
ncbi:hypothetical protein PWT90_06682 [Aphanocladium album]|nr:hypothetical protein PWT90_06682 [Aphanocladium album]